MFQKTTLYSPVTAATHKMNFTHPPQKNSNNHAPTEQSENIKFVPNCLTRIILAGSPGRAKSKFKYADPLKIFVLIYKKILINKIFHFEASYYLSQHGSHLHLTAPYSYLTDSNFWTCRSYRRM